MTVLRRLTLVVVTTFAAACGGAALPAPSDAGSVLAGTWTGSAADSEAGAIGFRFVLREQDGQISGSWTAALSSTVAATGSVSGAAAATPLVFSLSCLPGGLGGVTATRDGARLTGTYFFIGCAGLADGTFEIAREPGSAGALVPPRFRVRDRSRSTSASTSRPMPSW
jgi:hypothetical protein